MKNNFWIIATWQSDLRKPVSHSPLQNAALPTRIRHLLPTKLPKINSPALNPFIRKKNFFKKKIIFRNKP